MPILKSFFHTSSPAFASECTSALVFDVMVWGIPFVACLIAGLGLFVILARLRKKSLVDMTKEKAMVISVLAALGVFGLVFWQFRSTWSQFAERCGDYPMADNFQGDESRKWFEWEFQFQGQQYQVQFLDLPQAEEASEVEADAPEIQMILSIKKDGTWETVQAQNTLLDLEEYGEAPPAQKPIMLEIGANRVALLFAVNDLTQGVTSSVLGVFEVTPNYLGYRGHVFVGANNKENCVVRSKSADEKCFSWTGSIQPMQKDVREGLYDIKVVRKGDYYNVDSDKIETAKDITYQFVNGQYTATQEPAP